MGKAAPGIFVISLDFELYWGIRDKKTLEQYGENVLGAWEVVPRLLKLFQKYNIHATWAVVGAMMNQNAEELFENSPKIKPQYTEKILSPYNEFYQELKSINPKYLFGKELVEKVKSTPNQELGTHTFSHYYCLESGQTKESFISDLQSCIETSKQNGFEPKSYIFPRHQLNADYIKEFPNYGIETYRGTEKAWYHSASKSDDEGVMKRIFRFADYYFSMFSQHCQSISEVKKENLYEIRASRWLRPYSEKWKNLDFLKMRRIKSQMKYAAKNGKIFHLWFHPHDIGRDIDKNFEYLKEIVNYYQFLNKKYHFESKNFREIKNLCNETHQL